MSKVKKRAGLTGVRNVEPARQPARRVVGVAQQQGAKKTVGKAAKAASKQAPKPAGRGASKGAPKRTGPGTRTAAKKSVAKAPKRASKSPARGTKKAVKTTAKKAAKKVMKAAPAKRPVKGGRTVLTVVKGGGGRPGRLEPIVRFAIKELDPIRKCGPDTSVQFLYRVDESVEGKVTPHLVFFDRHGWYCEHGRTCPAVAPARKHNGHIARVS